MNKQEFRRLIERKFLPYVIKPARFLASEWRAGESRSDAPLAVIVAGATYESSLTNPLSAAVSEALIDSRLCDVGWLYQFGDQASERLAAIGAEPFVTPQLAHVTDASLLIVPLGRPSDVFAALKNLNRAGIVFGKGCYSEIIAVTDSGDCLESLRQEIFGDVFNRVYALDDLRSVLENLRDRGATLAEFAEVETKSHSSSLYFPKCPPGPVIEISQNRACFRFSEWSDATGEAEDDPCSEQTTFSGESIANAILDSGQTEFQLDRCFRAGSSLNFAELLDQISAEITPERYRVTLADLSAAQVSGFLPGALRRYRRARVDIKLSSLSESVSSTLGESLNISSLVESIKSLQHHENIRVQLTVCLGFPGKIEIECEETIDAIRILSQSLNPRSGLKIRFVHFTPSAAGALSGAAVRGSEDVEALFESIRRKKSRGISLTLLDSAPQVLDILIERGAFGSSSELTQFALDYHDSAKRDSAGMADILSPYQSYFSAQSLQTGNLSSDPAQSVRLVTPAPQAAEADSEFSVQPMDNGNSFGRGRKRSGAAGVAAPTKTRVRFTWTVSSHARYLSHLDNLRALEGALLRSRLPLSYTQGARPRPKVSFGPPLPVGFTSDCELFDAFFEVEPTTDQIKRLSRSLPNGFEIIRHETVYTKALSILEELSAADYMVSMPSDWSLPELSERLESALDSTKLVFRRTSKNGVKEIDLRPGVFAAQTLADVDGQAIRLKLTLALTDTFTIRPEDFLQAAGIIESAQTPELSVRRRKFYFGRMAAFRRPSGRVSEKNVPEERVSEEV